MDKVAILTSEQKQFLDLFGKAKHLSSNFYLSGGTALAAFYIPYRYSEDLDFFSENEVDIESITTFIRSIKNNISYSSFDISTSYNRNIIFLDFKNNYKLKTEFTYYPFPQIEKSNMRFGIKIDSIIDIATNKLFTIYQKPRSRDFMDLYVIQKNYGFSIVELIKKAKIKFDWHVDHLQLGTQFMQAKELKDYPRLLKPLPEKEWQSYFLLEAKKLKDKILSN